MNADQLIARARQATNNLYDDDTFGKKNYHIGFLESTIRELVYVIQDLEGDISNLKHEILVLQKELREHYE